MRPLYRYAAAFMLTLFANQALPEAPNASEYRSWIAEMKNDPKGPFVRIRWFCNDGEILPPKPYACGDHEGGHQHGQLGQKALILQSKGYWIANLLAGLDADEYIAGSDFIDRYNQLLIEKFLIGADNGWILAKAKFYRGAVQEEDERDGARKLLTALAGKSEWIGLRFPALRIGAQLLPHGEDSASVQKMRQLSVSLADRDSGFDRLRTKIHGSPDAGDAQLVRDYAAKLDDPARRAEFIELADEIDRVFRSPPLSELLEQNAKYFSGGPWLQKLLRDAATDFGAEDSPSHRHAVTARLLADLRDALPRIRSSKARLRVLGLSLSVEAVNFKASVRLREQLPETDRMTRTAWLKNAALAAYGAGGLNRRQIDELKASIARLDMDSIPLKTYLEELNYLARAPGWSTQNLRFQFYRSMEKMAEIEPMANLFIQDILRGSPMLFFSQTLDTLTRDANRQAGVTHNLFGEKIGVGFHALNPGLARGRLHAAPDVKHLENLDSGGIYLLPETVSDLPPIAGIITAGEGNPLSHVQLLARNLGIPNVTVDERLIPKLRSHDGSTVVMAVSPTGLVEIGPDSEKWEEFFGGNKNEQGVIIRPNLDKLDLGVREIVSLDTLRAADSGRIVGPKAAKLGELKHHYPDKVAKGIAIPFGVFREAVLDKPYKGSGRTVFDWMTAQYRTMQSLPSDSEQRRRFTDDFRSEIHDIILNADMGEKYRNRLREAFIAAFGKSDTGVFIRSDTNVEDLPGFTGAGLNLTLFNVVGLDNVFKGINQVWASPFTARAFAWRQSHMEAPEHVYPAILILQSVPNDKSGVLVTQDIDSGDMNVLSVAVNEGV
ncbi:MAG: PEP/pyruvate-binding domain-containing protein, partial [Gammaproteobacteria bacterium]